MSVRSVLSSFGRRGSKGVQLEQNTAEVAAKLGRLAEKGRISELREALQGAPEGLIDQRDANGFNPLQHACAEGHAGVVRLLLELGASADVRNFDGETALHLAASIGYDRCAEALIAAGADTALRTDAGKSALELAKQMGHVRILSLIESATTDGPEEELSPMDRATSSLVPDARDLAFSLLESELATLHDESLDEMQTILEMVGARIAEERARRVAASQPAR
jgi:ankyrin repeat protein